MANTNNDDGNIEKNVEATFANNMGPNGDNCKIIAEYVAKAFGAFVSVVVINTLSESSAKWSNRSATRYLRHHKEKYSLGPDLPALEIYKENIVFAVAAEK